MCASQSNERAHPPVELEESARAVPPSACQNPRHVMAARNIVVQSHGKELPAAGWGEAIINFRVLAIGGRAADIIKINLKTTVSVVLFRKPTSPMLMAFRLAVVRPLTD